jgi:hypothetical protein
MPNLMGSGKLKSNPLLRREGGLEKVNEGMDFQKAGKVRRALSLLPQYLECTLMIVLLPAAELGTKTCLQSCLKFRRAHSVNIFSVKNLLHAFRLLLHISERLFQLGPLAMKSWREK